MEPEQKLFVKIIIQLIEDLVNDVPTGADTKTEEALIKLQAKAWFRGNSDDYKEICDHAGINSEQLRKKVLSANPKDLQGLLREYRALI